MSPDYKLPPKKTQVLIVGGGPAGSYAASVLAREGLEVTVFEADKFPRYHVGESLIPSVRPYFRFIEAESILANYGFMRKPGAAVKFNQFKREGYTDFVNLGYNNNSWNVVRSEFDQLLMNHSRTSGASVYELTKVKSISFSAEEPDKPVSVTWSHTPPPEPISPPISRAASERSFGEDERTQASVTGLTTFEYIIDATGRAGIISTKYLKNRHFNASLKNIAVWGYWTNTGVYGVGTHKEGAPWFEALTDESGWAWFIPLHDGTTSVGVVMNQKCYNDLKDTPRPHPIRTFDTPTSSMVERYLSNLSFAPGLVKLLTPGGKMIQGSVKSASDYSYSAPSYAGNRYRIIGDAGAFIDPFFSSGVHLALTSALSAAASICASIRGDCSELDAGNWHTRRVATSYTRFQVVVLSAYKQIRAQNVDVLADVDEDNYDRAFSFLRPVIQGASDMGKQLTDAELQRSLDFCVNLFNPTDADEQDKPVQAPKIGKELLDIATPTIDPRFLENALLRGSGDAKTNATSVENTMLLKKINARKVIHTEYNANNMESEPLDGLVMKLEKGRLGLTLVSA